MPWPAGFLEAVAALFEEPEIIKGVGFEKYPTESSQPWPWLHHFRQCKVRRVTARISLFERQVCGNVFVNKGEGVVKDKTS